MGSRNDQHGDKHPSFLAIAELWCAYLNGRKDTTPNFIRPVDVANMMVLLKMGRMLHGQPMRDHFVDMAGYAAVAGELTT